MGDGTLRSRDHFGHLVASVKAHIPSKAQRDTGIVEALDELAGTVAKDMTLLIERAWKNGVAHGEWLREGECRRNAEIAAGAAAMKDQFLQLQLAYYTTKHQLDLAKGPVPVARQNAEISMEELQYDLDEIISSDTEECVALTAALSDITNRI